VTIPAPSRRRVALFVRVEVVRRVDEVALREDRTLGSPWEGRDAVLARTLGAAPGLALVPQVLQYPASMAPAHPGSRHGDPSAPVSAAAAPPEAAAGASGCVGRLPVVAFGRLGVADTALVPHRSQ
jgi:hypothetical protein